MRAPGLVLFVAVVACTPTPSPRAEQEPGDGGTPPHSEPLAEQPKGDPDPPTLDPDCVPADPGNPRSGPGPSIATWKDLDLDVLGKAFPLEAGDMKAGKVSSMKRGMAGHGSPNTGVQYTDAAGENHFAGIHDTQHQCHCREGMGKRLAEAKGAGPNPEPLEYAGNPGMANAVEGGASDLAVWVGDRCVVTVNTGDVEKAKTIAAKVDWQVLAAECAKREPK